jgi:flagellar export protein FliJ
MDSLIRLHRWQLDEKRRNLADLENMRADFESRYKQLEADLEQEKAAATEDPDTAYGFSDFVAAVSERKHALQMSIDDIDNQIDAARREVEEAMQELKKLETVENRRQKEHRETMERREQQRLDDMALDRHRRRAAGE